VKALYHRSQVETKRRKLWWDATFCWERGRPVRPERAARTECHLR